MGVPRIGTVFLACKNALKRSQPACANMNWCGTSQAKGNKHFIAKHKCSADNGQGESNSQPETAVKAKELVPGRRVGRGYRENEALAEKRPAASCYPSPRGLRGARAAHHGPAAAAAPLACSRHPGRLS